MTGARVRPARLMSLAHGTLPDLSPPELIRLAARAGYDAVGLSLYPPGDGVGACTPGTPLFRETSRALAETGLRLLDVEVVPLTPGFDAAGLRPFLAASRELGARYVIAHGRDPDPGRLANHLAVLCDEAARVDLVVVLEFFPWIAAGTLGVARRIVEAAAGPTPPC